MILPRAWVPKPVTIDYGAWHISGLIDASKGDKLPHLAGLFYKQTEHKRSQNGYKAAAAKMGKKFALGLLTAGRVIG